LTQNNSTGLDLIKTLTTLNEISASINQLGAGRDLPTTLTLIAEGAMRAVAPGLPGEGASAVIWVFDAARRTFDRESRVAVGGPDAPDDFPRLNGLGMQAIQQRQRIVAYSSDRLHPARQEDGVSALVCFPLIVGAEAVGALYVYRGDNRPFSEVELLILDNYVQLAAFAIHYGRKVGGLSQALSRKVREMEKLNRAAHLINSRTNLDETLHEILAIGLDITAAQYGSFELYDRKRQLLLTKALAGTLESPATEPVLGLNEQSIVGWVALHRQSLRLDDVQLPPWREVYHPLPIGREMRSELAVPIIGGGGGLEGILNIESPQPHAFTEDDQQLLESLATQAAIAIQEIRLLDAMQEIVRVLLTAADTDLFRLIIDRACDLINGSDGSIWIVSAPDTLVLRQSTDTRRVGEELSLHTSLTGRAVRLRQPVVIDDVRHYPTFTHPEVAKERGWISAIVVPLLAVDDAAHPVGSFSLYTTDLRDFSDWDKKLLTCLANHAAVAIRDAEQLRQLKQAQERQATAETIAAVGDVAANLLHQLNNKFGAISVRVQGIEDKCADALTASPYLDKNIREIAHSARQAMKIVRDSMAPLQPLHARPVELADCLEQACLRATLPPEIELHLSGLKRLPRVLAGEKQLEMVFFNLIDNARRAMAGRGQLFLTGAVRDNFVGVTVGDTGPGIPPEKLATLFDFTPATERQPSGRLSFGLWWVKTFVDRFGGYLELDNRPGQGCRFTVWLPAERGQTA
jgi:GAF domain-containing protein